MKKEIIFALIFLISLSCVSASNFSKSDGLTWLNTHVAWGTAPIDEVSFSLLALDSNAYDTTTGLNFLKNRKDSSGCYSSVLSGSCTSKDTALAALALSNLGENIQGQLDWINQTLKQATISGDWIIQVIPGSGTGECNFTHGEISEIIEITEPSQWIYLVSDLGIEINAPLEIINVNCGLPSNTKISLLRRVGTSEFHIIEEHTSNNVNLIVNSACYAQTQNGNCDIESSFYVAWILNELNENIYVLPYLEDSLYNNILYYSMLQKISPSQTYLTYLTQTQNSAGYWAYTQSNIYATSFAIDSLYSTTAQQAFNNATNWLKSQQVSSGINIGSWNNGNVLDTAVALYLGLTHIPTGNNQDSGGLGFCSDGVVQRPNVMGELEECDDENTISGDGCSSFCKLETITGECNSNTDCTNVGEICNLTTHTCELRSAWCWSNMDCLGNNICDTTINTCIPPLVYCTLDISCEFYEYCDTTANLCKTKQGYCSTSIDCLGTQICDSITHVCIQEGQEEETALEEEEEGPGLWWIWLIVIIIIIIGVVYAYFKFSKPKKKEPDFLGGPQKPSYSAPQQPRYQPPQFTKSAKDLELETELDKSIKEAQDLFKKKK